MRRVLIVGDDAEFASRLEAQLTECGYCVSGAAANEPEAVALAARTKPDLVLMNLALDCDGDGLEGAEAIGRRWSIPVLLLTANSDAATARSTGGAAPVGFLAKPFAEWQLRLGIEMALFKDEMRRESREFEEKFFSVSIDLLCFLDFNGYFRRLNPAWETALGFTREELMAKPFIEFVHPDDRERTLAQNRSVRGGGRALSFENRYLCKDGSHRWLLWNAAPDLDGQVIYSVARDITARKEAEEEREEMVRTLRTALAEVKVLREILPICSYCRKIRDDDDYWQTVEAYVSRHTDTRFSHGICPVCYAHEVEPLLDGLQRSNSRRT